MNAKKKEKILTCFLKELKNTDLFFERTSIKLFEFKKQFMIDSFLKKTNPFRITG